MATIRTNRDRLVRQSVTGDASHPRFGASIYRISVDGAPVSVPGSGGITYDVRVGNPANGWRGDHIEPAVSLKNPLSDEVNGALQVLARIGNEATIASGKAAGSTGHVTGKHGGIDHMMVDFTEEIMQ